MALSRVKNWIAEVLKFADLNNEFDNILNNPLALISTASVASKGLVLIGNGTVLAGLNVGSDAQVLTADSTQSLGVKWAAVAAGGAPAFNTITSGTNTGAGMIVGNGASLVPTGTGIVRATDLIFGSDAKGDLAVRTASAYGRVAVGANGTILRADSSQTSGVLWGAPVTSATNTVATSESTSSLTYTDLATSGPNVTTTPGPNGILMVFTTVHNDVGNIAFIDFALSGGNTRSATDTTALKLNASSRSSAVTFLSGLSASSTTVTMKYRTTGSSSMFENRNITVLTW